MVKAYIPKEKGLRPLLLYILPLSIQAVKAYIPKEKGLRPKHSVFNF